MSITMFLIGAAMAGQVKPAGVEASSYLVSDKGEAYEGKGVTDGKLDNGWLEGDDSSGLGSWVKTCPMIWAYWLASERASTSSRE